MQWSPFQSQNWIWSWDQRFYFLTLCQNEATKLAKNKFRFSRAIAYSYISISFANVVIMFKPFDRWCQTHWCHILKRPPWQAARGGRRPYLFFFLSENNHSIIIIIMVLVTGTHIVRVKYTKNPPLPNSLIYFWRCFLVYFCIFGVFLDLEKPWNWILRKKIKY